MFTFSQIIKLFTRKVNRFSLKIKMFLANIVSFYEKVFFLIEFAPNNAYKDRKVYFKTANHFGGLDSLINKGF